MAEKFTFTYEEKKIMAAQTADILTEEIGLKGDAIEAVKLIPDIEAGNITVEEVEKQHGESVARILRGLSRIQQLYEKNPAVESENFRNLLLSFAEDMRVILIMIANRVNLMRQIRDTDNQEAKIEVSQEAAYLYAPLAHKLGLYKLKSELEDLSLKYMEHDAYYHIREKLSATKAARDAYIERFIKPVEEKVKAAGIKCHMVQACKPDIEQFAVLKPFDYFSAEGLVGLDYDVRIFSALDQFLGIKCPVVIHGNLYTVS